MKKRIELRATDVDPKMKRAVTEIAKREQRSEGGQLKVIVAEWLAMQGK